MVVVASYQKLPVSDFGGLPSLECHHILSRFFNNDFNDIIYFKI